MSGADCHAVISRSRRLPDGRLVWECAWDAIELEGEDIDVGTADEQAFRMGTPVPCPPA